MEKVKKFFTSKWFKGSVNGICFTISLLLLIYNVSIIGYFILLIRFGEEQGEMLYMLLSTAGILLILIPLLFKMTKQRFYHFSLIVLHLFAIGLPFFIKFIEGALRKI